MIFCNLSEILSEVYMQGNSGVVTQAEIANMFGVSDRQARNYLSLLLNDGKICAV